MKIKKVFTKRNIFLIIIFVLLLLLFSFIPFTGDDWQNYGNGKFGFLNVLRNSFRYYLHWEGRIGSRIIIFLVTYNKWMWNIIASLSVMFLVYFSNKLIGIKNKKIMIFIFVCLLLLLNYDMLVQCFFWIAGHITYTACTVFFIFYMYYIFNKIENNKKYKLFEKIGFLILNLGMCTFVENIAVGIVVFNLLILFNSFFFKKDKNIYYVLTFLASLIGLLIQILSPGTATRISIEMGEFGSLSIFAKIIYNLNNFIHFEFIISPIMLLIMLVAFDLLVYKKENNLLKKYVLLVIMNVIPVLTIIGNINLIFPFQIKAIDYISNCFAFISDSNNIFIIIYWIVFDIIYFICLILYFREYNIKLKLIILYMVSQSCILSMLVTPTWSNRVAFTTVILNYVISLIIINNFDISYNKLFKRGVYSFCIVYFCFLFVTYYKVDSCINYRDNYILEQYEMGNRVIDYYVVPSRLLWSQYPYSDSYRNAFNGILGLKEDVKYNEKLIDW